MFDPVVCYDPIDDTAADVLAAEFATRLGAVVADAEAAGKSVKVFHWSHPERSKTSKYPQVNGLLKGRTFDLHAWFNHNFLTCDGASIKAVAPIFGFHWSVEDAGGAQSQVKIDLARTPGPEAQAAREWIACYNESDVAAQAAIRDGLRRARAGTNGASGE